MGMRLRYWANQIRVGDTVHYWKNGVPLVVVEIILGGNAALCEIEHGDQAGVLLVHKMRDLVKIGPLQ
jgi:hypothetical protein